MTLKEWSEQTGIRPTYPTTEKGAVSVICDDRDTPRVELYHVSDYKVSTVSGNVIWLVPVKAPEEPSWEEHCHGETTSRREDNNISDILRSLAYYLEGHLTPDDLVLELNTFAKAEAGARPWKPTVPKKTVIQMIATKVAAYWNCYHSTQSHLKDWEEEHLKEAYELTRDYLPSGNGFNHGTILELSTCTGRRLVFKTAFHHMDQHEGYVKWTEHEVIVTPAFTGIDIKIRGENYNQIKDYIAETFYHCLTQEVTSD